MAATVCPTVLAGDTDDYKRQMERIAGFATRIHIDLADGVFAPTKTIGMDQVWWPANVRADLHVMYAQPFAHAEALVALGPQMVIVHAEAEGEFVPFAETLHAHGIEIGVALLAKTSAETIKPALSWIDYVLVFSGDLGHFGGKVDLGLLDKIRELKGWKPQLEVGWDGGINDRNAEALVRGGVDVLNTGGYIQKADNPAAAYRRLQHLIAD